MGLIARTPDSLARWLEGRASPMALNPYWLGKLEVCPIPRSYPMCVDSQRQRLPRVDELRLLAQPPLARLRASAGSAPVGLSEIGGGETTTGSWIDAESLSGAIQMFMVNIASTKNFDLSWGAGRRLMEMELQALFGAEVEEGVDMAIDAGTCWLIIGPNMVEGPRALKKIAPGEDLAHWSGPARDGVEATWAGAVMELADVYGRLALAASLREGADVEADAILGPLMQRIWTQHEVGEVSASAQGAQIRARPTL